MNPEPERLGRLVRAVWIEWAREQPQRGDRVEWNPTGQVWTPATVIQHLAPRPGAGAALVVQLDENGEYRTVQKRHTRPAVLVTSRSQTADVDGSGGPW